MFNMKITNINFFSFCVLIEPNLLSAYKHLYFLEFRSLELDMTILYYALFIFGMQIVVSVDSCQLI